MRWCCRRLWLWLWGRRFRLPLLRSSLRSQIGLQILLRNPVPSARPFHLAQIDIVLPSHLPHQRRKRSRGLFHNSSHRLRRSIRLSNRSRWRRCCCRRSWCLWCRCLWGRRFRLPSFRSRRWRTRPVINPSHDGINPHRFTLFNQNLGQRSSRRRRNLGVHFVRRNFEQRLIAPHRVPWLFQPLGQRSFDNTLPHLGHDDVNHKVSICRSNTRPKFCISAATTSPRSARQPRLRIEVTGRVKPHGTMYRK